MATGGLFDSIKKCGVGIDRLVRDLRANGVQLAFAQRVEQAALEHRAGQAVDVAAHLRQDLGRAAALGAALVPLHGERLAAAWGGPVQSLLTVYAAAVAMVAGMFVAVGIFRVEPLEYLVRSGLSLSFAHLGIGLLKATVYGLLVGLAGCRQGLFAGRSAQAVGDATTAAVVQAIVWIVVAASALTISFQRLGW